MRIKDCPECLKHLYGTDFLIEACASVGISRGLSTSEMLVRYLSTFHEQGHDDGVFEPVAGEVLPADVRADSTADVA